MSDEFNIKRVSKKERFNRTHDSEWLKRQIEALAKDAEENAQEDEAEAKGERDDRRAAALQRASEAAAYYAKKLHQILQGYTPQEALVKELREATKPMRTRS
jgi:acyl-CoA reductase-like NAD-dependent aldehyde dehydrogenase